MDFYGCHFEYAGELSRKYGLVIANIDTSRNTLLSGKVQTTSAFNKRNNIKHSLSNVYSDAPFSFEMEVVSDRPLEGEWRRMVQKWLFNQRGYQKLYVDSADDVFGESFELSNGTPCRTYLNCRFVNPEKIEGNGGIAGFKFLVECDSHLAWQDPLRSTHSMPGGSDTVTTIRVVTDTDSDCYIYPKVTLTIGNLGGTISLANLTDSKDRVTTFIEIEPNTILTINGAYNFVSDNYYGHFVDRNFPRLLDGENDIEFSGDVVSVELEWQNMRYL